MYYSLRYPTTCNVNFQFPFDRFQPNEMSQVQRAVEITAAALQFKFLIDTESLEPDRSGALNGTDSRGGVHGHGVLPLDVRGQPGAPT